MKKTLLALTLIVVFAASSFASVSFLTAPSVGEGKWAVLGVYATNHVGNNANNGDGSPQNYDSNSIGVRGEYGVIKDLDVLVAYSYDTLPNVKELDVKQESANTMDLGVKYTVLKNSPVDVAVALGYESSNVGLKINAGGSGSVSMTSMTLGCIVSQQIGMFVPYGAIALKSLSQTYSKKLTSGIDFGSIGGTGLAFNFGCAIGVAENQAVMIEYNTENQAWAEAKKGAAKIEENALSVSGISLGYVYMF